MSIGGHARQTPNKGIHPAVSWTFADATARTNFTPTDGIPTDSADLVAADVLKFGWQLDNETMWVLTGIAPVTWVLVGGDDLSAIHVDVAGEINGIASATPDTADVVVFEDASDSFNKKKDTVGSLVSSVPPGTHASSHSAGQSDEVLVENLGTAETDSTFVLRPDGGGGVALGALNHSELTSIGTDDHHARDHAGTHADGGADEISVEVLAASSSDTSERLRPDGSGGLEWEDASDIYDFDGGTNTTSGTTFLSKASITIPAEDATFIIEATILVSNSNTTMNGSVRLQNTTDAATLGRAWEYESADSDNIVSATFRREFVQTSGAGSKTIELQYALASGSGTLTVSDALLRARRVVS